MLSVGGLTSYVENNGEVTINNITQPRVPVKWNNMPGSTLTISEKSNSNTPTLQVFQLNNGTPESSQQASTVNLNGTLQLASGIANVTSVFNNYSQLNVGPIGQVVTVTQNTGVQTGGELTNNPGGTITSQNPCYYGNQVYSITPKSVNPFDSNPV